MSAKVLNRSLLDKVLFPAIFINNDLRNKFKDGIGFLYNKHYKEKEGIDLYQYNIGNKEKEQQSYENLQTYGKSTFIASGVLGGIFLGGLSLLITLLAAKTSLAVGFVIAGGIAALEIITGTILGVVKTNRIEQKISEEIKGSSMVDIEINKSDSKDLFNAHEKNNKLTDEQIKQIESLCQTRNKVKDT